MTKIVSKVIIALGSNQTSTAGSPDFTLTQAIRAIEDQGGVIRAVSEFYKTPCFPKGTGPDYVNAAILLETEWAPDDTIARLHAIEQIFGRERIQRWGQRTLDLDIVAIDDIVAPDLRTYKIWRDLPPDLQKMRAPEELILPHPRIQDRAFVLVPLADIQPKWIHPVTGLSVVEMLNALPESEKAEVKPIKRPQ